MKYTKFFKDLGRENADIAGGKGASLGEMTQAKISVPPGFAILSSGFEFFLSENDLVQEIESILKKTNHKEMESVDRASEEIKELIMGGKMPTLLQKEIKEGFTKLGAKFVAVRSSATAEDGAEHAWAGQLDTFLNTTSKELEQNVKKCFASLFTPRAIFYRFEKGLHKSHISVAVVVQKMVQSEKSGIAFSVHPVTQDWNQMIIEGSWGLGEAIVSGQVTPDSYVVEKDSKIIIDINVSNKTRGIFKKASGGNEWKNIPAKKANDQCLSGKEILELGNLIIKIEKHYGFPCDIEWAFEKGKFYITQSRPITTLKKSNSESEYYESITFLKLGRWATMPLDVETWHTEEDSRVFEEKFGIWKEILALNVFGDEQYNEMYVPVSFIKRLYARIDDIVTKDKKGMEKIFMKFYDEKEKTKQYVPTINPPDLAVLSDEELAGVYKKNRLAVHNIVAYDQFTWLAESYWLPHLDNILIKKHKLKKGSSEYSEALFALMKPRHISTTLEERREVLGEVISIHNGKQSKEKAAERLAKDFGWMPVLAYGVPWGRDKYEQTLDEILPKDLKKVKEEYEALCKYSDLRDRDFDAVVKKYDISKEDQQIFVDFGLASDTRNEGEYMNSVCGFYLMDIYDELAKRFGISVFELRKFTEREVLSVLGNDADPKAILAEKKGVIAWLISDKKERLNYVGVAGDKLLEYINFKKPELITSNDSTRGITANRGKACGRVRLVSSPELNHIVKDGDVLFAYSTMVDNLPAMKRAVAFVTESGGLTCHAAVVAREFSVPCIVSYKDAMSKFKDGDMVEVDADKGIVKIIK